jgi:hypothetical protein
MEAAFICSEELWLRRFGEGHPLRRERLKCIYGLLTAYRAFDAPTSHLVGPRPAHPRRVAPVPRRRVRGRRRAVLAT